MFRILIFLRFLIEVMFVCAFCAAIFDLDYEVSARPVSKQSAAVQRQVTLICDR